MFEFNSHLFKKNLDEIEAGLMPLTAEEKFQISSIKYIDNEREIDFCLGTSSSHGIITAGFCCQADEMIIVDLEKSNEIDFEIDSVVMDDYICIINKTDEPKQIYFNTNDNIDCSIIIYDNHIEDFVEKEIDFKNFSCLNQTCYLESYFESSETILIGTSIICGNSSIVGIVMAG